MIFEKKKEKKESSKMNLSWVHVLSQKGDFGDGYFQG